MSLTKNTKDNRQVVRAEYKAPESVFEIPDGLDLEDKSVVEWWGVKYNTLKIKYVNGEEVTFAPKWDAAHDDLERPSECEIILAEDVGYKYFWDTDEDEEDEEEVDEDEDDSDDDELCCGKCGKGMDYDSCVHISEDEYLCSTCGEGMDDICIECYKSPCVCECDDEQQQKMSIETETYTCAKCALEFAFKDEGIRNTCFECDMPYCGECMSDERGECFDCLIYGPSICSDEYPCRDCNKKSGL